MRIDEQQWEEAQRQVRDMDPQQLLQQAAQLKAMDKHAVRRTHAQFAHMSDAEIDMAATQMEMMASNPQMMAMARQQMSGMSANQAQQQMEAATKGRKGAPAVGPRAFRNGDRVKLKGLTGAAEHNGKHGTVVGEQGDRFKVLLDGEDKTLALKVGNVTKLTAAEGGADEDSFPDAAPADVFDLDEAKIREATQQMRNADPEQMRAQARAMRQMDPKQVRAMNPQMAQMTDEQIRAAADQMEMLASNPDMMKTMMAQMDQMSPEQVKAQMAMVKNMSPAQREEMQAAMKDMGGKGAAAGSVAPGGMPGMPGGMPGAPGGMDMAAAAEMMKNVDEGQMASMINMVKANPAMMKSMLKSNPMMGNISDAQIDAQMQMLDQLDPDQLKKMLGYAAKAQKFAAPFVSVYAKANRWCNGKLKHVLAAAGAVVLAYLVGKVFGLVGAKAPPALVQDLAQAFAHDDATTALQDDEFGV